MSADKDRGIRRIKQKRAKALKREGREQRNAAVEQRSSGKASARRPT